MITDLEILLDTLVSRRKKVMGDMRILEQDRDLVISKICHKNDTIVKINNRIDVIIAARDIAVSERDRK